jgi:antitoxin ParD1/3/4
MPPLDPEVVMSHVERLSITLPVEMARLIRAKVESGDYATDSDVVRAPLHAWQAGDSAIIERLSQIRSKIAEADMDPRPSLTEDDVDRHFKARSERQPRRA